MLVGLVAAFLLFVLPGDALVCYGFDRPTYGFLVTGCIFIGVGAFLNILLLGVSLRIEVDAGSYVSLKSFIARYQRPLMIAVTLVSLGLALPFACRILGGVTDVASIHS